MTELKRVLGPFMIWGLGVGMVISGAYFGWNLGLPVAGPVGMLLATVAVTIMYVCFVLSYAELAASMPRAGGAFVYARRALGPTSGAVAGLAQYIEYVLAPPAIALAIGGYAQQALAPWWPGVPVWAVAGLAYVAFTLLNIVGVKQSALFELVITVIAVLEVILFGAITLPHFSVEHFMHDPMPAGAAGVFAALPFAIWFYLAIEGIANVAEEAKNPQRDVPRGFTSAMATLVLVTAVVLCGAVGVGGWQAVVYPNPADTSVTSDAPLPMAIKLVLGASHPFLTLLTSVGLLGLVASFHGILLAGGRSLMELGRAGYVTSALGEVNASRNTPARALVVNAVIGLLAIATGRTGDLIVLSVFGALTLYLSSMVSVLVLRRREPDMARPYRVPGHPWVPTVALLLAAVSMAALLWSQPKLALMYGVVLALGTGVWRVTRREQHPPV